MDIIYHITVVVLLIAVHVTNASNLAWEQCSEDVYKHSIHAQALITGLFPIRVAERTTAAFGGSTTRDCGPVHRKGLETMEAVRWALRNINQQNGDVYGEAVFEEFIPGITIGIDGFDTCGKPTLALKHSLDVYAESYSPSHTCFFNETLINLGVIGPATSSGAKTVASFLSKTDTPVISYAASSTDLKNDDEYPTFIPTRIDVETEAETMVRLAKIQFRWRQVALVICDTSYAREGRKYIVEKAQQMDLCISNIEVLPGDNLDEKQDEFHKTVQRLKQNLPNSPGVLVFSCPQPAVKLLETLYNDQNAARGGQLQLVFSNSFDVNKDMVANITNVRGIFTVGPITSGHIPEFTEYWNSITADDLTTSWSREYYQKTHGCRLVDETSTDLLRFPLCKPNQAQSAEFTKSSANGWIVPAVDATYAYVLALRDAWQRKCLNRPGLCPLLEFFSLLQNQDFTYEASLRAPPSFYGRNINFKNPNARTIIYQLQPNPDSTDLDFTEVLIYDSVLKQFQPAQSQPTFFDPESGSNSDTPPPSACIGHCTCISPKVPIKYDYKPGNVVLSGFFPIHDAAVGASYMCGPINSDGGLVLFEAFKYAINRVNAKADQFNNVLHGIQLGHLAFDTCASPTQTAYALSGLMTGEITVTSDDYNLQMNDIAGFIGGNFDNTTMELASMLSHFHFPLISYGASSVEMSDSTNHPQILMTGVSDASLVDVVVRLIKEQNWNYVQTIYSQDAYGRSLLKYFEQRMKQNSLCIANNVKVSANADTFAGARGSLRRYSDVQPVIVLLSEDLKFPFFRTIEQSQADNHLFIFLKLVEAGKFLTQLPRIVEGSLILMTPPRFDGNFEIMIKSSNIAEVRKTNISWYGDYVKRTMNCEMESTCELERTVFTGVTSSALSQATKVVDGVYALVNGLHEMLKNYCGANYRGLCGEFRTLPQRNAILASYIKQNPFIDGNGNAALFTDRNDISSAVEILTVTKTADGISFILNQAGSYMPGNKAELISSQEMKLNLANQTTICTQNCGECSRTIQTGRPVETTRQSTRQPMLESLATSAIPDTDLQQINLRRRSDNEIRPISKQFLMQHSSSKLYIGALIPLHKSGSDTYTCGTVSEDGTILVEALLWALDMINANQNMLPGIELGVVVLDTCDASAQIYEDIKMLLMEPERLAAALTNGTVTDDTLVKPENIVAFVNTPGLTQSQAGAKALNSFNITNISPDAFASNLDAEQYPFSLKVSVSANTWAESIVDLLTSQNASYVNVIHGTSGDMQALTDEFVNLALTSGICLGQITKLHPSDQEPPNLQQYSVAIETTLDLISTGARTLVLMLEDVQLPLLTSAWDSIARMRPETANLTVIIVEPSLTGSRLMKKVIPIGLSSNVILVTYDIHQVDYLVEYVQSLTYATNPRNVWWQEFWSHKFGCADAEKWCSHQTLGRDLNYDDPKIVSTIVSVWSIAVGLNSIHSQYCASHVEPGLCPDLLARADLRQLIFDAIRDNALTRPDIPEENFVYTEDLDGNYALQFNNLIRDNETSLLSLAELGSYTDSVLTINQIGRVIGDSHCIDRLACPICNIPETKIVVKEIEVIKTVYVQPTTLPTTTTTTTQTTTTTTPQTTTAPLEAENGIVVVNYDNGFIYIPAGGQSLLLVFIPIHARGTDPFSCGKIRLDAFELTEAALWSMAQHNTITENPNTRMDMLIIDSCSNPEKALSLLANFMSEKVSLILPNREVLHPINVIGAVTSIDSEESLLVSQLLDDWNIPVVIPGMVPNIRHLKHALTTGLPSTQEANIIFELIKQLHYKSIIVLSTGDPWSSTGASQLRETLTSNEICVSDIYINEDCNLNPSQADFSFLKIAALRQAGTRVIASWLPEKQLKCFIEAFKKAKGFGLVDDGDLTLILPADLSNSELILQGNEFLGALSFGYQPAKTISGFQEFYHSLKYPDEVTTDVSKLLFETFHSTFSCDDHEQCSIFSLEMLGQQQNTLLLNMLNALKAFQLGVERSSSTLCGNVPLTLCLQTREQKSAWTQTFNRNMKGIEFGDITERYFKFVNGSFSSFPLRITNYVKDEEKNYMNEIGEATAKETVIAIEPIGFTNNSQTTFELKKKPSKCIDSKVCGLCPASWQTSKAHASVYTSSTKQLEDTSNTLDGGKNNSKSSTRTFPASSVNVALADTIVVPTVSEIAIAGIFPVHQTGANALQCGALNSATGFQKLAAFFFALQEINSQAHILPQMQLGAIAVDSCSSSARAEASLFEFLSGARDLAIAPENVFSIVGLENSESHKMNEFLKDSTNLIQMRAEPTPLALRSTDYTIGTADTDDVNVRIMLGIVDAMGWSYISLVYEEGTVHETTARYFQAQAAKAHICIARSLPIKPDSTESELELTITQLVLADGANGIALFVSDVNIIKLLEAVSSVRVAPGRFIFMMPFNENWMFDSNFLSQLSRFEQGAITIEMQRYNNTRFEAWLTSLTPDNHEPIPTIWFDEFWQHTFSCQLENSNIRMAEYEEVPCTGEEKLQQGMLQQSPTTLPTILGVHAAAQGLQKFINKYCPGKEALIRTIGDCVSDKPRDKLINIMRTLNFSYVYNPFEAAAEVQFDAFGYRPTEYSIRTLRRQPNDGNFKYEQVAVWKNSRLTNHNLSDIYLVDSLGKKLRPRSQCPTEKCAVCYDTNRKHAVVVTVAQPLVNTNFDQPWGIAVTIVASIGVLMCIVALGYFGLTLAISFGTTILGYMNLIGIAMLYALSLSYVVTPSEETCAIRRYCTGLVWSFIFGPLFIKVCYNWHFKSAKNYNATIRSSPSVLACMAIGMILVEVIITVEWIMLQQPTTYLTLVSYMNDAPLDPAVWRCTPGEGFETMMVVSLIYVMFLIFMCTVFSLLSWSSNTHNHESRWVFVSCVSTVVIWMIWCCMSTQSPLDFRDSAVAIGYVANATIILICLYLRKIYTFSKISPSILKEPAKSEPVSTYPANFYNTQYMVDPSVYAQTQMYYAAANSIAPSQAGTVAINQRPAIESSSPMYVQQANYTGGSQFNPGAAVARSNGSGVVIYETSTLQNSGD